MTRRRSITPLQLQRHLSGPSSPEVSLRALVFLAAISVGLAVFSGWWLTS
jgi:hypothetical protein